MDIHPYGSAPSRRASAELFTGTVWQDPIVEPPPPARVRDLRMLRVKCAHELAYASVRADAVHCFRHRSRSELGRLAARSARRRYRRIAPNGKHWHGAGPNTIMAHIER